jgi:hypothetical protein
MGGRQGKLLTAASRAKPAITWVDVDDQAVDPIEFALKKTKSFLPVPAQAHAMRESGRHFQHGASTVGVGIHQQDDFFFHFSPFDREK